MTVMIRPSTAPSPALTRTHRLWGVAETDAGRYGCAHTRLRIFPPDITPRERSIWRAVHVWPAVGLVLAVLAAALLAPVLGTPNAVGVALLGWMTPMLALWLSVGRLSARIRELWSNDRRDGTHDASWIAVDRVAPELDEADDALARGEITPAEHRARWQAAYAAASTVSSSRA